MVVNREKLRREKERVDKLGINLIKKDSEEYKKKIETLKEYKRTILSAFKYMDAGSAYDTKIIVEDIFYDSLVFGIRRKDIKFFEDFMDRLEKKCDELKKKEKLDIEKKVGKEIEKVNKKLNKIKKKIIIINS